MKIPLQELQILHNSVAPWYCENKTNLFSYTSRVWHLMKMFRGIFIYMYTYMSYHRSNFLSNPRCSFSDVNLMCNIWRFNNTTPPPPSPFYQSFSLDVTAKKAIWLHFVFAFWYLYLVFLYFVVVSTKSWQPSSWLH